MLTSKILSHRRSRCLWENWFPAFAGKTRRGIASNHPNVSQH
jgi:hypothetical protein